MAELNNIKNLLLPSIGNYKKRYNNYPRIDDIDKVTRLIHTDVEKINEEVKSNSEIIEGSNGYYALLTDFYFGGTGTTTTIGIEEVDTYVDVNFTIAAGGTFDNRPKVMKDAQAVGFDSATGLFTLEGLTTNDFGAFRASMSFDPDEDNGEVDARLEFVRHSNTTPNDSFPIEDIVATMNEGAETDYPIEPYLSFFIGDTIDTNGPGDAGACKFQIKSSVPGTVTMRALTWYIYK